MAKYRGPSKTEKKQKSFLLDKANEARQKWGNVRRFGRDIYTYVGTFYPSGAKWYRKEYGDGWRLKLIPIRLKKKVVGFHVWWANK